MLFIKRKTVGYGDGICTPQQWIFICNTLMLALVSVLCAGVIYEIYDLDHRLSGVIYKIYDLDHRLNGVVDSSMFAFDLTAVDQINSEMSPHWIDVTESIAVYSAFYDSYSGNDPVVMVIGSNPANDTSAGNLYCLIKFKDDVLTLVHASLAKVPGASAVFFICSTGSHEVPEQVAIISVSNSIPKQWIKVELLMPLESALEISSIAACVKPLIRNAQPEKDIAEFVAFYEQIGFKEFYFYNHNASYETMSLMHQLMDNGHAIHILPWELKSKTSGYWYDTRSEFVQDCVHRCLGKNRDIVIVDVHDFIVPRPYLTLPETLETSRGNLSQYSKLFMKHVNFCKQLDTQGNNNSFIVMENEMFHGDIPPVESNYILRLQHASVIRGRASKISNNGFVSHVISENDVVAYNYRGKCENDITPLSHTLQYVSSLQKLSISEAWETFYKILIH